jgi:SAM-dependent methyltransferase
MSLASDSFNFVYCRASFKNFGEPVQALKEMYRVLKPGGRAVIHDMRQDASPDAIRATVEDLGLGWFNSLLTRWILRWLRKRAYSLADFRQIVGETPFGMCEIKSEGIGAESCRVRAWACRPTTEVHDDRWRVAGGTGKARHPGRGDDVLAQEIADDCRQRWSSSR